MQNKPEKFSFVRDRVISAIRNCEKIVVVGPPNDYYKIYLFSDTYRYYKVELKGGSHNVPKRFNDGGKGMLLEKTDGPLGYLVNKATAYTMFSECPYEPTKEHPHVLKPNAEIMEWVKYLLTATK